MRFSLRLKINAVRLEVQRGPRPEASGLVTSRAEEPEFEFEFELEGGLG